LEIGVSSDSASAKRRRGGGLRRRLLSVVLTLGILLGGFSAVSIATASPAQAQSPSGACWQVVQAAKASPYYWWSPAAAFVGGACVGYTYSMTPWWNSNFDRILNRCWPNCSGWDFTRMILGIPG
jgi:hypothetical protein